MCMIQVTVVSENRGRNVNKRVCVSREGNTCSSSGKKKKISETRYKSIFINLERRK